MTLEIKGIFFFNFLTSFVGVVLSEALSFQSFKKRAGVVFVYKV